MGWRNAEEFGRQSAATTTHRAVGILIALRIPDEDPTAEVFYAESNLAGILGKTESNIRRSVHHLRDDLGELQTTRRPGRTNLVQVCWKVIPDHSRKGRRAEIGGVEQAQKNRAVSGPVSAGDRQTARGGRRTPRAEIGGVPRGDRRTPRAEIGDEQKGTERFRTQKAPSAGGALRAAASSPESDSVDLSELHASMTAVFGEVFDVNFYSLPSEAQHEHADARVALVKIGAAPVEVRQRASTFRDRFADRELTPSLLVELWGEL